MLRRTIIFLVINFAALGIGSLLMGKGATTGEWYQSLNKAPWTPPGWVFGAAWTTIMICFSLYMARLWEKVNNKKLLLTIFSLQFVLNVMWNPTFFRWHYAMAALVIIVALTTVVATLLFGFRRANGWYTLLIAPYLIWLMIATSLNGYITSYNF